MSDGGLGHCGCHGDGAAAPRRAASHLRVLNSAAVDCRRGGVRGGSPHRDRKDAAQYTARLIAAVQLAAPFHLRVDLGEPVPWSQPCRIARVGLASTARGSPAGSPLFVPRGFGFGAVGGRAACTSARPRPHAAK